LLQASPRARCRRETRRHATCGCRERDLGGNLLCREPGSMRCEDAPHHGRCFRPTAIRPSAPGTLCCCLLELCESCSADAQRRRSAGQTHTCMEHDIVVETQVNNQVRSVTDRLCAGIKQGSWPPAFETG